ncbi:hypothetical protein niasHT_017276 [Heterodera trifolii]|uniref:C2H2-type domain-containing protein n=1 Tax=Heterodera trifolii TaxID=157864 RepID=A0ABD2LGS2_9BILA
MTTINGDAKWSMEMVSHVIILMQSVAQHVQPAKGGRLQIFCGLQRNNEQCTEHFSSEKSLMNHQRQIRDGIERNTPFCCRICRMGFTGEPAMRVHLVSKHAMFVTPPNLGYGQIVFRPGVIIGISVNNGTSGFFCQM